VRILSRNLIRQGASNRLPAVIRVPRRCAPLSSGFAAICAASITPRSITRRSAASACVARSYSTPRFSMRCARVDRRVDFIRRYVPELARAPDRLM
jgi:hypothetical protein